MSVHMQQNFDPTQSPSHLKRDFTPTNFIQMNSQSIIEWNCVSDEDNRLQRRSTQALAASESLFRNQSVMELPSSLEDRSSSHTSEFTSKAHRVSNVPHVLRVHHLPCSAIDRSSVFCLRSAISSDKTSNTTGNKRSQCRCVISVISELFLHLDYGYSGRFSDTTTQMDYIATESHRSLATRLFRFDTRSPRAKFFASLAYSFNRPPLNMLCSCY